MRYEIYTTNSGSTRVNIGEHSFGLLPANPLSHVEETIGGEITTREIQMVLHGNYGEEVQAWAHAALALEVPLRFASRRQKNMRCDIVSPPWVAQPKDWNRDPYLSISVGDTSNGTDAQLIHVLEVAHA